MTLRLTARITVAAALALSGLGADGWSQPVQVLHDTAPCVTYRAKRAGEYLVVEARHESPWHTVAMDNAKRAEEKLAGKKALSFDRPTEVRLPDGFTAGEWRQTRPKDMSKPELRMFTWGFEGTALFAAKVAGPKAPMVVNVRGQVCTDSNCKTVDVKLHVPAAAGPGDPAVESLEPVRR